MNPKMKELRAKAMALPLQPGVYIMKNAQGEIIYIGKAKKAEKPRQPVFRLPEQPYRKGAPHGRQRRRLRIHHHRQRV